MSFLYPLFLVGAIAVAIPVVLHLFRREVAPEIPFSAVRLLRQTPLERTRRRRLRELVLLAARIAALALLAFAFARPYLTAVDRHGPLHIVAIDRSFSMGAPGRFERAIELAREAIAETERDPVAVIAFDDRAELIAPPGSQAEARASLTELRAGFGATRYAPLVRRAGELGEQDPVRLTVISDMQRAGWEGEEPVPVPPGFEVETRDAGETASNIAVTAIRRGPRGVIATLRASGEAASGVARASVDGAPVASAPFTVAPGATADVPIDFRVPNRGALTIEVDDPAGYAADNRRHLLLEAEGRTPVLVIGDSERAGFYLTRALQAADVERPFDVRVRSAPSVGSIEAEDFATNRAVLLMSTRGLDRRARDRIAGFVRSGGGLLITAAAEVDPTVIAAVMQWPGFAAIEQEAVAAVLAATDLRHPIFRPFGALAANLGQVRFSRAWHVRDEGWDVAARFTDGSPALLERVEGKGRVVVFASDLERRWNDFPLHPAFVPFVVEAVRHVIPAMEPPRDFLVGQTPPEVRPEPGAYTLAEEGRPITVNVDVRESATGRVSAEEFRAMIQVSGGQPAAPLERRAQQTEAQQNLWRYGVLLMLAALVVESLAGRAR